MNYKTGPRGALRVLRKIRPCGTETPLTVTAGNPLPQLKNAILSPAKTPPKNTNTESTSPTAKALFLTRAVYPVCSLCLSDRWPA